MMRSLFSAISGLKNHQFMMDTVGNNIANVNTVAYKSSRATFQGLIDQILSQGNLQASGKPTDLALQGEGYFVLSDNDPNNPRYSFTRDGNLGLGVTANATDPRPLVHTSTGLHVKGWVPPQASGTADSTTPPATDITIPVTLNNVAVTGFTIDANGVVNLALADGTAKTDYAQLGVATFSNAEALLSTGKNLLETTANTGQPLYNGASVNGRGTIAAGYLEMSNVDLATEFSNMIIAERGFQANSRVITASDEVLQDLVNIKH